MTLSPHPYTHTRPQSSGFTLVELAIVMTVIGLVIAGIIQGQAMIKNARATSTIAQMQAYQTAIVTFHDMHKALPGDMATAQTRIPHCSMNCAPHVDNSNDGIVGNPLWATDWNPQATLNVNIPAIGAGDETVLFWAHLSLSDLIGGVNDSGVRSNGANVSWTETHPAAKIGGGFIVGFGNGAISPGDPRQVDLANPLALGPRGLLLLLVNSPLSGGVAQLTETSQQTLSVAVAEQIDKKIDDGFPHSGRVRAYGLTSACFGDDPDFPVYTAASTEQDCGLIFEVAQ